MITQIEIDGFKTFKDFKVELAPFQVIVGPNGSGKSNLFDALQLLSRLAEFDINTAFQDLRGAPDEQFMKFPNHNKSDKLHITVEILIDNKIQDDLGTKKVLKYVRLRYELEVTNAVDEYGLDRIQIVYESLASIPIHKDIWSKKYRTSTNATIETTIDHATFISTDTYFKSIDGKDHHNAQTPLITLYRDDQIPGNPTQYRANDMQRTLLSAATINQDPHVFAVRQELRSLQFIHLSPSILRQPSSVKAQRVLSSQGGNLPTTLARMQAEDQFALHDVSLDMASLVPDFSGIEVRKDDVRNEYTLWATYADGRTFSSRVLSDGTLQLLALATLKNDPHFHGVLCFEEPENGVNPAYLANIARLLRGLATDFSDPQQREEPLRQVLVTTHSPAFITQPDAFNALLYMYTVTQVSPQATGIPPMRVTQATPVLVSGQATDTTIDKQQASYTLAFVRDLLANDHTGEAIQRINESRAKLNKQN